jgi:hypothetical protein
MSGRATRLHSKSAMGATTADRDHGDALSNCVYVPPSAEKITRCWHEYPCECVAWADGKQECIRGILRIVVRRRRLQCGLHSDQNRRVKRKRRSVASIALFASAITSPSSPTPNPRSLLNCAVPSPDPHREAESSLKAWDVGQTLRPKGSPTTVTRTGCSSLSRSPSFDEAFSV